MDEQLANQIDALLTRYDNPTAPGMSVGVIVEGDLCYAKGYGIANLEYDVPITPHTVFHVASMSKQFTATCVALLEEQRLVSLNEDIRNYFPELPQYPHPVTVGDLVYMTNGLYDLYVLANYTLGIKENDEITRSLAWELVRACDWLMFEPGTRFSYGNTGYFLLAELIERVSGLPLAEYAARHIFTPLGMNCTFFRDDRSKIIRNRAESYSGYEHVHYNDRQPRYCSRGDTIVINACNTVLPGAGQLYTTLEDLYLWDQNFYNNKLGQKSPDLINKMTTSGKLANGENCGYGYGLFISNKGGVKYIYHGGWSNGYSCMMLRIPDKSTTVICLGNHTSFIDALDIWLESYSLPERIMELVHPDLRLGPPSAKPMTAINTTSLPDSAEALAGRYYDTATAYLWEVKLSNGRLIVTENTWKEFELIYAGENIFESTDDSYTCEFEMINGTVQKITVSSKDASSTYYPFVTKLPAAVLQEYCGEYRCPSINTTFEFVLDNGRLLMQNKNRVHTGIDFYWDPIVVDHFIAQYPPYCPWYTIEFRRDARGKVNSFVFRDDEGSQRENLVFARLKE